MTDVTKYKSVAIDHESYKKIEELTTCLTPGITLSRAQVVKILVDNKTSENKNTNETIVGLFSDHTPQQRQEILRDIDNKMFTLLELSEEDLPWVNSKENFSDKWVTIMENLRLVVAKLKYEQIKNGRSIN